jgi:hypothetical protein
MTIGVFLLPTGLRLVVVIVVGPMSGVAQLVRARRTTTSLSLVLLMVVLVMMMEGREVLFPRLSRDDIVLVPDMLLHREQVVPR